MKNNIVHVRHSLTVRVAFA